MNDRSVFVYSCRIRVAAVLKVSPIFIGVFCKEHGASRQLQHKEEELRLWHRDSAFRAVANNTPSNSHYV